MRTTLLGWLVTRLCLSGQLSWCSYAETALTLATHKRSEVPMMVPVPAVCNEPSVWTCCVAGMYSPCAPAV